MKKFNNKSKYRSNNDKNKFTERKEMHTTICADCGASCQVPFKPRGEKPVYCSPCFSSQSESSYLRPSREKRERHDQVNSSNKLEIKVDKLIKKLDKIIEVLTEKNKKIEKKSVKKTRMSKK